MISQVARQFHVTGAVAGQRGGPPGTGANGALHPVVLAAFADPASASCAYPLALAQGQIALGPGTLFQFYREAIARERAPLRQEFALATGALVASLDDLLRVDAERDPSRLDPQALSATLDDPGGRLLDPVALSAQLRTTAERGTKRLDPDRRARIEHARDVLSRYLAAADALPECVVVHAGEMPAGAEGPRIESVVHPDGLAAAIELFDARVGGLVTVLRALRVARLEVAAAYDPALHGPVLERFGWQSCEARELLLLPPIVVWERGRDLRGTALAAFSELLHSGRPVHVLVSGSATRPERSGAEGTLAGHLPDLGSVAVAHREAFVLQTTLARPLHVLEGLRRMARAVRPSVALVAVAPEEEDTLGPWARLAAAHDGRGTLCFRYDPDAGETWSERFDLSENPQAERTWPIVEVRRADASGGETLHREAMTLAHVLALDPCYRRHYLVLERDEWSDEQSEVADYLAAGEAERARRVPYVWVVGADGVPARAVITREMAFACRDRMRAWRMLQELAGAGDEHSRRAADEARRAAEAGAAEERQRLAEAHRAEVTWARGEAAREAIDRLVAVLMGLEALPVVADASAAALPPPAPPAPATIEATPAAAPPEQPYIDSALCTTCNECTNLNPRLFRYNANKQATIADPAAGTYKQLVLAAEKCPARCIHPGVPRAGDATATPAIVARASAFR